MGRLVGRIWVGGTTFLIAFIAYSSQIFIIWPWYGGELSVELLQLLVPFNILVAVLYWNYLLCVRTDPGRVPKSWHPDTQSSEGYEVKKLTGGPRYCRTCANYKPPRAHHCRQCRRCILRMDHHCPWVNNCVGHFNYGHFIRFLFYVDISCAYHLTMVTRRVMASINRPLREQPAGLELAFIVLNYTACVPVMAAVGGFSLYHFYCLCSNMTTIEGWEKDKVATLIRRGKIREVKYPYNLGTWHNITSVLGTNPLLWCCPTVPSIGTGLKYRVAEGQDDNIQNVWPPKDPSAYHDQNSDPDDDYDHPDHTFTLPDTPWTYDNDALNPDLRASSSRLRSSAAKSRVPPYHSDYRHYGADDDDSYSDEHGDAEVYRRRVRRGSEGYEVREIVDREEILRRYVISRGEEAGRYRLYVPEPGTESENDESQTDGSGDDDIPLAQKVNTWQTTATET